MLAYAIGLVSVAAALAAGNLSLDKGALRALAPGSTAATLALQPWYQAVFGTCVAVAVVAVVSAGIAVAVGSGTNVPLLQLRFYTRALPGLVLLSSALFFSVYSSIMFLTDH